MSNQDQPAFPLTLREGEKFEGVSNIDGLTKREYFAVMAMQGVIASDSTLFSVVASVSVQLADELIKELEKMK